MELFCLPYGRKQTNRSYKNHLSNCFGEVVLPRKDELKKKSSIYKRMTHDASHALHKSMNLLKSAKRFYTQSTNSQPHTSMEVEYLIIARSLPVNLTTTMTTNGHEYATLHQHIHKYTHTQPIRMMIERRRKCSCWTHNRQTYVISVG